MENAIKAMYMAVGMILAVLLIGVWMYMFRSAGKLSESYEFQKSTEQVQAFNTKFEQYAIRSRQRTSTNYGYSFKEKGNIAADVISCANLAYDINRKNDYDLQQAISVKVKISPTLCYYVVPYKIQEKNKFIKGTGSFSLPQVQALAETGGEIPESNYYDFNDFLQEYNEVRIVNIESNDYKSTAETIYKYYFDVKADGITYSEVTGKIQSITFEINETEHFNDTTYWKDIV